MNRRLFLACALAFPTPVLAQSAEQRATMSVSEAHQRTAAKEAILIDIRTPEEWKDTGVAEGAIRLDMTSPAFEARLDQPRRCPRRHARQPGQQGLAGRRAAAGEMTPSRPAGPADARA